ncbi:NADH-quinone oxidoreductase subunit F [Candidatus Johnevansia muelleri]|uniref:NADH-quinone oxidoreductase subunit F n=1 Tax=Candidatus Johnevansia muelleri TaxID=1495769 RepID=A0A078KET4_9GAMM|nr:NADH-quinone oxidoreductase subunit F [Candidatus Evansia muelleri]
MNYKLINKMPSFGKINLIEKNQEKNPLTWRLNNDGQPVYLKEYKFKNGYIGAQYALIKLKPNQIIEKIIKSGLKGRGGAGFPTGIKWNLTVKCDGIQRGYLICNADEMEPNTYKDRMLIEQQPHLLIEGMIIAGYANNSKIGYIFLRGEYIIAYKNIKFALEEARSVGLLGENILDSGYNFDIFIHVGAGRYICGEETALMNSLEGRRANPRAKPPFPGQSGVWGKPTVINNVETLCNIPSILALGVKWYHSLCRPCSEDHGTKLMGFTGKVKNPGLWELPLGITARELLENFAGGMQDGYTLKAWQPGGASTGFLLPKHLDIEMYSNGISKLGTRIGTALALAIDNTINIVSLICNIEEFFSRESCGFCTPCRDGLPWIVKLLQSLEEKKGKKEYIDILLDLTNKLSSGNTFCAHAPGAMEPLKSAIYYFYKDFENGIKKI